MEQLQDKKPRGGYSTRFKGKGVGLKSGQKPVSTTLPNKYDEYVRSLNERSEFIRQAVIEKIEREGLLEKEENAS